jgi:hypothetical protein
MPDAGCPACARARSASQGYRPDYLYLLQRLCMDSPEGAVNLAKTVARQPGPPIDLNTLADLFLQRNMVREATAFLLDVLQDNAPEHDKLQTKARRWPPLPAALACVCCPGKLLTYHCAPWHKPAMSRSLPS